jgi:hypothetical protein
MVALERAVARGSREDQFTAASPGVHFAWFTGGAAFGFAVPFLFTSVLDINHDVYYGLYFAVVAAFLAGYVRSTKLNLALFFTRAWVWSLALAVPTTAFVVARVLSQDATQGPGGLYSVFEVGWRGIAYGTVDALLLTAFPGAVALALLGGRLGGIRRHTEFAALALVLTAIITATYHLGYEQFRDDGVSAPETGNLIISLPMAITGNPLGSIVTHASMHTVADVHAYETDTFLPPQTEAP